MNSNTNQVESEVSVRPDLLIDSTHSKSYPKPVKLFIVSTKDHRLAQSILREVQAISIDVFTDHCGVNVEQISLNNQWQSQHGK